MFCLTMGVWIAVIIGVTMPGSRGQAAIAALVTAIVSVAVGLGWPRGAVAVYNFCARGSRFYARIARVSLLAISYSVIVTAVARGGSRLRLRRPGPGESLWEPVRTLPTNAYHSQFGSSAEPYVCRPWTATVIWAFRSGNAWTVVLLPFMIMISALELDDRPAFPSSGIYTLF